MESVKKESKKSATKIERMVLDEQTIATIQKYYEQINNALGDSVQVTHKDVGNFLINVRLTPLTDIEINKFKNKHFDIVRVLKLATQEAIKAKQNGNELEMTEILKLIQTPSVNVESQSLKLRGRKKKSLPATDTQLNLATQEAGFDAPNELKNSESKITKSDSKAVNTKPSLSPNLS